MTRKPTKFLWGLTFDVGLHLYEGYYDGPFWDLRILWFWAIWNLDGLPYIFWE